MGFDIIQPKWPIAVLWQKVLNHASKKTEPYFYLDWCKKRMIYKQAYMSFSIQLNSRIDKQHPIHCPQGSIWEKIDHIIMEAYCANNVRSNIRTVLEVVIEGIDNNILLFSVGCNVEFMSQIPDSSTKVYICGYRKPLHLQDLFSSVSPLHWYLGNCMVTSVPVKQPGRIGIKQTITKLQQNPQILNQVYNYKT